MSTAWKVSKYGGDFSVTYFSVFGLNTWIHGPEKTPYLNTLHGVVGKDQHISGNSKAKKTASIFEAVTKFYI